MATEPAAAMALAVATGVEAEAKGMEEATAGVLAAPVAPRGGALAA